MAEQPAPGFAGLLRQLRAEALLTQEELAEAARLSPRSVSDLERGIHPTARKDTAVLLAGALGLAEPVRSLFIAAAVGRIPAAQVLAAMQQQAPVASAAAATRALPSDTASFTGRDAELALLEAALASLPAGGGAVSICLVDGMAGIGKTTLAVHAAHRLAAGFPAGQFFLPLHAHTPGQRPVEPAGALASLLLAASARNPRSTWCVTVTDSQGHAIGHGCARPAPVTGHRHRPKPDKSGIPSGPDPPAGPSFNLTPTDRPGPPGGYGTWRFFTGIPGQRDLLIDIGPLPAGECDHRHEAKGHDPGVMLRHLTQVRHATCTGPGCRRPAVSCDFEHNIPYEAGGRTCLCNGDPKCRFDHRVKQDPRWRVEQLPSGHIRWTTPSGRRYVTEPTRYPI
jgi:transcriptional regulator with XRE-family HTH domain